MPFTGLQQDYLGGGLAAARPSAAVIGPTIPPGSCAFYFATDSNVLYRLAGGDVAWQIAAGGGGGGGAVTLIASHTTSGSAASVSFAAIPNTYNNLQILMKSASDDSNTGLQQHVDVHFNGDTTSGHYSGTGQGLYGGGPTGFPCFGGILLPSGNAAGAPFGHSELNIPGYLDAVLLQGYYASSMSWQQNVGIVSTTGSGMWNTAAAITQIDLAPSGGFNWKDGSQFDLYGIT